MSKRIFHVIIFMFILNHIIENYDFVYGQVAQRRLSEEQKAVKEKPPKQTSDISSTIFSPSGKITFEEFNPHAGSKDTGPVVTIGGIKFKGSQYAEKGIIIATDSTCDLLLAYTSRSNLYLGTSRKEKKFSIPPTPHSGIDNIYIYFIDPKAKTKSSEYKSTYANNVSFDLIGLGASVEVVWYDEFTSTKKPKIINRKTFSAPFPERPIRITIPDKITGFSIEPLNLCYVCNYGIDNLTFGNSIPTDYKGLGLIFWHKMD